MALTNLTNSTSPNTVERATADGDPFDREHVNGLAQNFDEHDHTSSKGLPVGRVQTSSAPAQSGQVRVNGDTFQWWGSSAGAVRTAVDTASDQTIAGEKVFSENVGVGVTPSAWGATWRAVQIGQRGALWSDAAGSHTDLSDNTYYDGTDHRAIQTATASKITLNSGVFTVNTAASATAGDVQTFAERLRLDAAGALFVGDTSNANMTVGLTINQGTADDEALALKSSDVAHGMTDLAETDTYGTLRKMEPTQGGLGIHGYGENNIGMRLNALAVSDDTTKSAAASAYFDLLAQKKTGATAGAQGANANLVMIRDGGGSAQFIFDADGDSHQNVGTAWTNFDAYDDTALLNSVAHEVARPGDPIKDEFRSWLTYNREALEKAKLVAFNEAGGHFVNMSRLTMLLVGALRQQGEQLRALSARVAPLLEAR